MKLHTLVIVVTAMAMTGFVMTGSGRSARASSLLTVLKVLLLAGVAAGALLGPASPAPPPPSAPQPLAALLLVFFAFVGFERPTAMTGEVRGARINVPLALTVAMLVVGLLYAGVFVACLRDLPGLARSEQPVGELAMRAFGPQDLGGGGAAVSAVLAQKLVRPQPALSAPSSRARSPSAPSSRRSPRRTGRSSRRSLRR